MRDQAGNVGRIQKMPRAARTADRPGVRPEQSPDDSLWGVREVADYLKLPVHSIYKMTASKATVRIPHIRIGGKLRFRRSDVDQWLTLLTVSNIGTLSRVREKVLQVTHGNHSQAAPPQR